MEIGGNVLAVSCLVLVERRLTLVVEAVRVIDDCRGKSDGVKILVGGH